MSGNFSYGSSSFRRLEALTRGKVLSRREEFEGVR